MNRQPYGRPPKWWPPKLNRRWVRLTRGARRRRLRRRQRIERIDIVGLASLQAAITAGRGALIVANHATHYDSEALYAAADKIAQPLYFMIAWQVFAMSSRFECWALQRMGCFSVDRESTDRRAFQQAVTILRDQPHPLVMFPEGDIYHVSDRVLPFRPGAAAVALSAAKRSERAVVVIPCGIRFSYLEDPTPSLDRVLAGLERTIGLSGPPPCQWCDRIRRLADVALAAKETTYLGAARSGRLRPRMDALSETLLDRLEQQYRPDATSDGTTPGRVKLLRQTIIAKRQPESSAQTTWQHDLDALFFVMQLYSYPSDYLSADANIERIAETVDKLEEDLLGLDCPTVHGRRRVLVAFGESLEVARGDRQTGGAARLTERMQTAVQSLLDRSQET